MGCEAWTLGMTREWDFSFVLRVCIYVFDTGGCAEAPETKQRKMKRKAYNIYPVFSHASFEMCCEERTNVKQDYRLSNKLNLTDN